MKKLGNLERTQRLAKHLVLCRRNLKSKRVKCCLTCPFEDYLVAISPDLEELWLRKRSESAVE